MKKIALLAALALSLGSCSKNDISNSTTSGKIRFSNTSDNPYEIFISGSSQGTLSGNKFKSFVKDKGPYTLKAKQLSGYVLYPTVRELDIDLEAGKEIEFVFP